MAPKGSSPPLSGWYNGLILLLLAGVVALGFLHLGADFPNHSRWMDDPAKFTDEGWWASGAFNHILTGHWLRPGDYNPMIATPFWSVLMELLFHFTGISVIAARAVAFLFTVGTVIAVGRLMARDHPRLALPLMLLVASSPVLYFFSHLAILEPALIFFLTCAALAAYPKPNRGPLRGVVCGLCFTLAMLTKTSALFVLPAIAFLLWFPHWGASRQLHAARRRALLELAVPAATFALLYGLYWLLVLRTHRADLAVFYGEAAPAFNLRSFEKSVRVIYRCFTWVDPLLVAVAAMAAWLPRSTQRRDPLFGFAVVAFLGYCVFMVWHVDAGPRYFAVLVIPVTILALLVAESLERSRTNWFKAVAAVIALAALANLTYIVRHAAHPEYMLRDAGLDIRSRLLADSAANPMTIGHGAAELTYFTHLPALDDLGSATVEARLAKYRPGWLLTWEDNCSLAYLPGVASAYTFHAVASYRVFDVPGRERLLLYRIQENPHATSAAGLAEENATPPSLSLLPGQTARPHPATVPCSTP